MLSSTKAVILSKHCFRDIKLLHTNLQCAFILYVKYHMQTVKALVQVELPFMHYFSTQDSYENAKNETIAKFKMLSFCQNIFSQFQISSCKCSM